MKSIAPRSLVFALVPTLLLLCGFSCDVPLAPGYRVLKESRGVRFVPGQTPELRVQTRYVLRNSGSADLTFVDAIFPEERSFGRKNLRVQVSGREATLSNLPGDYQAERPNALRIALDPPWQRKQTRELLIEYTLSSPENLGARITIEENSFHLGSSGWFPELLPPKHLLAPHPNAPKVTDYTIRVPADFFVLARGASKGRKADGSEMEHRFVLDAKDLAPYVVAGRYAAWPEPRNNRSAVFWTLQPLKDDPGPAAERLMAAWNTLEKTFGPLDKNIKAPHIVEAPGFRGHLSGETGPAAADFPGGAIVNPAALELGTSSDRFLEIVTHALAHDWFGDQMYPSPDAALGIGEGLPEYATIVVDEAHSGPDGRRRRIVQYLRRYDEARSNVAEIPLGTTLLDSPAAQRRIALAKAPLFFVALEDACGEAPFRAGLAHLLVVLRGQEVDYNALRSALEQSTSRNLGSMFRLWLNNKGIPDDFRSRYQGSPAGEVAEK
ncbi:MAG: hypothetical protein LAN36_09000 [Acidobacteriia bacterium]|nr:hypothetical protein [Terriglobia bacterium]